MNIDLNKLRRWIGQSEINSERLTDALVQKFNATFDRKSHLGENQEAPLLIHLCLGQPTVPTPELGEDGHPDRGAFLPPVPLPRRMWAGGSFRFHQPLRIGDQVTRASTIQDVTVKEGRSGPLCFVTVEHIITSGNRHAITERQDIVYRGIDNKLESSETTLLPPPPAVGEFQHPVCANATLLFRYSALTFNGHRIHYDHPYATKKEGYPGLVVQGPLQATMLAQFASDLKGLPPSEFKFRSVAPLYDNADFRLNASADGEGLKLWTDRDGSSPFAMEANATW